MVKAFQIPIKEAGGIYGRLAFTQSNRNRLWSTLTNSTTTEQGEDSSSIQSSIHSSHSSPILEKVPKRRESQRKKFAPPPLPEPSQFPDWSYEARDYFRFELVHQSTKSMARVGRIHTPHGVIDTPGFVAVATNAALKVSVTSVITENT